MTTNTLSPEADRWIQRLVVLSLLMLFFSVPHTLEDFAAGEPVKKGIPAPLLAGVVSVLLGGQALGLYWLGARQRRGFILHIVVGVVWPLAAGFAQLPVILGPEPYRSGPISVAYVVGIIVLGVAIAAVAALGLRASQNSA